MVLSRQVYISDGTTKQYPIAFADGYLSRDEVNVYEEYDDGTPDKDIPFTFINDNLIQLTTVPKSGTRIVIERDVEASSRKVVFIPQYIKSSDLNTMYQHLLYLIQALMDGRLESTIKSDLDMGYNKIINLGAPTNDNDAVRLIDIKTYTDLAQSLNQQNAAHEAAAKVSETNAKASENAAKASQNAAAQSAQSAANTVNGFDAHAAQKQQEFDNNAAQKQAQVDASAETARKWAIGTISEQPNGSAKYWAEQAQTATAGTLNESILTNCLTEIPQDIKLELSNGTLTLKAGSKVYKGDGTAVTVNSDVTHNVLSGTSKKFVVLESDSRIAVCDIDKSYSQDTEPTNIITGSLWYNTTTKEIKRYSEPNWNNVISFPLCICSLSDGKITSIDQVFNGFGYIGNTIFALPGIKGLIPNGFNTDGSLNSIEIETSSVTTVTKVGESTNGCFSIMPNLNLWSGGFVYTFFLPDKGEINKRYYVISKNKIYAYYSSNFIEQNGCLAGSFSSDSTGRITSLTPNTAFHATDYNEFAREVGRSAKVDEDNTFTGVNKFNEEIIASKVAYTKSNYVNGFSDILLTYDSNKDWWAQLRAQNTSTAFGYMGIYVNEDTGEVKTDAPTPPISDNSRQIATTAWINNKFQKVRTLPAQPDPNVTYLIPEE